MSKAGISRSLINHPVKLDKHVSRAPGGGLANLRNWHLMQKNPRGTDWTNKWIFIINWDFLSFKTYTLVITCPIHLEIVRWATEPVREVVANWTHTVHTTSKQARKISLGCLGAGQREGRAMSWLRSKGDTTLERKKPKASKQSHPYEEQERDKATNSEVPDMINQQKNHLTNKGSQGNILNGLKGRLL